MRLIIMIVKRHLFLQVVLDISVGSVSWCKMLITWVQFLLLLTSHCIHKRHHQWFIIIIIITIITITINLMMMIRTHGIWFLPSLTEEEATSILHSKEPGVRHLYLMKWFINENQIFSELPGAKIPHHPFLPLGQAWIVSWICCPSL